MLSSTPWPSTNCLSHVFTFILVLLYLPSYPASSHLLQVLCLTPRKVFFWLSNSGYTPPHFLIPAAITSFFFFCLFPAGQTARKSLLNALITKAFINLFQTGAALAEYLAPPSFHRPQVPTDAWKHMSCSALKSNTFPRCSENRALPEGEPWSYSMSPGNHLSKDPATWNSFSSKVTFK